MHEDDSPSKNFPEPNAAGAADVDDAKTADLQQKKVPDCATAADFVDAGTLTAELRDSRVSEPGDVDYARGQAGRLCWKDTEETKSAILEATETRDLVDAPRGTNPRGPTRDFHAKDGAVDDIECGVETTNCRV